MRGEREIRPKWPAIYTFLGRGKWWQKAAICGLRFLVCGLRFTSCQLSIANCPFASCCLLCGWDCFHVLMTNHHMPISNNSNIKVSNERKGWSMAEQHICMLSGHYSIAWSGRVSDRWGGHWHMRTRGGSICPNVWICNLGTFQRD
jgi:hypothetical protein